MKSMNQSPKNKRVCDTLSRQLSHKQGFPIEDVWNTDNAISRLLVPRLQAFKALDKHGYPPDMGNMRKWNNTIQKMIDAFELLKCDGVYSEEENRAIEYGLDLFRKYYRNLWD